MMLLQVGHGIVAWYIPHRLCGDHVIWRVATCSLLPLPRCGKSCQSRPWQIIQVEYKINGVTYTIEQKEY